MASLLTTLRILTFLAIATGVVGCELFVIGGGSAKPQPIERSQRTSAGVVHLFKAELDSNNTTAATELMRTASGQRLLAVERYELADDLVQWRSIMNGKVITETVTDTVSATTHTVLVTLDYIRDMRFSTTKLGEQWWITKIQNAPRTPR